MHDEYYFVINPDLKQQAISRFNRINPAIPQQYKAVDISDVKELYFAHYIRYFMNLYGEVWTSGEKHNFILWKRKLLNIGAIYLRLKSL